MKAVSELRRDVGVVAACKALGISRATWYRQQKPPKARKRRRSHRALSTCEKQVVVDTLNSEEFMNVAPAEVYATLLDRGTYLCSIATMYRLLRERKQVRERRNQRRHVSYKKPELLATGPRQLWSWDITKLKGPVTWDHYHLYVILDVFSRYVVGWTIAEQESSALAERLIAETIYRQKIEAGSLTLHADRGSSMRSKRVAGLLGALGVTKTHSRPHVSNDNCYSESQFKTLKHRPEFPKRFGSLEDATSYCRAFFHWYNHEHRHHGLALLTPDDVHHGRVEAVVQRRQQCLEAAQLLHPERFGRPVRVPRPREEAWINPPKGSSSTPEGIPGKQ